MDLRPTAADDLSRNATDVDTNQSCQDAIYRLPEDAEDDDNPGMHRYYGYEDIRGIWTPNRNTFTAMLRPGTDKTSFEVTRGYGESMIDYDYKNERIGIGIDMNDFLMRGQ